MGSNKKLGQVKDQQRLMQSMKATIKYLFNFPEYLINYWDVEFELTASCIYLVHNKSASISKLYQTSNIFNVPEEG